MAETIVALEVVVVRPVDIEALDLYDESKMGEQGSNQKEFHGALCVVEGPKSGVKLTH